MRRRTQLKTRDAIALKTLNKPKNETMQPNLLMQLIACLVLGTTALVTPAAHASLNAICQFKQQRMPCNVVNQGGQWTIRWQDGIIETYKELSGGRLRDKRGGIWTIYSRRNHTYLKHANGNVIDIFY